ncbi:MAG: hypothetical protein KIT09_12125 [Bryobacteraceae bacterium]|nr:hypothetical protein [Bryobacteraceae bacterium]
MPFDPTAYGQETAEILALDGNGFRLMPLASGCCSSQEAAERLKGVKADALFVGARAPEAAFSGLWLYFSCLEESHQVSQRIHSSEGSFWHAIMHRQEPDPSNSAYWFRQTGRHLVFEPLLAEATRIAAEYPDVEFTQSGSWDPFAFIDFCEHARCKPGSAAEELAMKIQRAEWQLLFDHCARAKRNA